MSESATVIQVIAEATRLWAEIQHEMMPGEGDLAQVFEDKFTQFSENFDKLLSELAGLSNQFSGAIAQNLNPYSVPMYLHIHGAIPRKSDGYEKLAIPNQNNNNDDNGFIMGRGRIHCLGLAGSFSPSSISMTIRQYKTDETMTRQETNWSVPICNADIVPNVQAYGGEFNSAYAWIAYVSPQPQPPSHCSGLYPYFERFGYYENTHYTRFYVNCLPVGKFWSAACVWESEYSHSSIIWRDTP